MTSLTPPSLWALQPLQPRGDARGGPGGWRAGPAERTHEDSEGQAGRGLPRLLAPGAQGCVQPLPQPKLRVPNPPPLPSLALVFQRNAS